MRIIRPHDKPIHFVGAEMKDAGFAVVDPDDAMVMFGHECVPVFGLSKGTTGAACRSLYARSVVAVIAVMMMVVMVVIVMMMMPITMMMVVLHRRGFGGRSRRRGIRHGGQRRQGKGGNQDGRGKKSLQHLSSFREVFRLACFSVVA